MKLIQPLLATDSHRLVCLPIRQANNRHALRAIKKVMLRTKLRIHILAVSQSINQTSVGVALFCILTSVFRLLITGHRSPITDYCLLYSAFCFFLDISLLIFSNASILSRTLSLIHFSSFSIGCEQGPLIFFTRAAFGFKYHFSNFVRYGYRNIAFKAIPFKHPQRKEKRNGWQYG